MLSLYRLGKFVFRYGIPSFLRYPIARVIGRIVYLLNPRRRRTVLFNLKPVIGESAARSVGPRLMGNFAMTSVDFFCARDQLLRDAQDENFAVLEKTWRRHKKVIVVTAHLGNWEFGMSYLLHKGFSMAGLYAPYREDKIVRWIMDHRNADVEWIPVARGAAKACLNALERGRLLGLVGDIPFGEKGRRVKVCGAWARLPLGLWAIAARARAAVVPGFALRDSPGRYRVVFHEPILAPEGSFRKQMEEMQNAYVRHLETYLTAHPEQWGVLQPFWDRA